MVRAVASLGALLFISLAARVALPASAQPPSLPKGSQATALRAQIVQKAPQWLKQYDVPSVAIAYIEGGQLIAPGWEILVLNGQTIIDHSGDDWGVHSFVFYLPSQQRGMVVFTNGDNGGSVIREVVSVAYRNPLFLATV
jgi:hypothetical protein